MSEKVIQKPENIEITRTTEEIGGHSEQAFKEHLELFAKQIPEISHRPELKETGVTLINEFGLKPEFFKNPDRVLLLAGIASRLLEAKKDHTKAAEAAADLISLIGSKFSDKLTEAKTILDTEDTEFDDATRAKAYERFTDKQLTAELQKAIDGGLLQGVKERLQVTPENEDSYTLHVLTVAESEYPARGMSTGDYMDHKDTQKWTDGLIQRGHEFAKQLGVAELPADAWVTVIEGKRRLCISAPFAEKILRPEVTENSSWYGEDLYSRDMAVLEHEYTHTQGGLNIDQDIVGISLEEMRAEFFSGEKLGYQDVKAFLSDYAIVTGQNIKSEMKELIKGGSASELYTIIANRIGLSAMVDVVYSLPDSYATSPNTNSIVKGVHESTGGYNGVLKKLFDIALLAEGEDKVNERIIHAAENLAEIIKKPNSVMTIDMYLGYRRRNGVSFVAEMIAEQAKKLL